MPVLVVALIAFVCADVVLVLILVRGFPERLRARSTMTVDSELLPDQIVGRLRVYVRERSGWRVETRSDSAVRIRTRMTGWTWRKRIDVSLEHELSGRTTILVTSSSPQLFDWGDNRRAVREIASVLSTG